MIYERMYRLERQYNDFIKIKEKNMFKRFVIVITFLSILLLCCSMYTLTGICDDNIKQNVETDLITNSTYSDKFDDIEHENKKIKTYMDLNFMIISSLLERNAEDILNLFNRIEKLEKRLKCLEQNCIKCSSCIDPNSI